MFRGGDPPPRNAICRQTDGTICFACVHAKRDMSRGIPLPPFRDAKETAVLPSPVHAPQAHIAYERSEYMRSPNRAFGTLYIAFAKQTYRAACVLPRSRAEERISNCPQGNISKLPRHARGNYIERSASRSVYRAARRSSVGRQIPFFPYCLMISMVPVCASKMRSPPVADLLSWTVVPFLLIFQFPSATPET